MNNEPVNAMPLSIPEQARIYQTMMKVNPQLARQQAVNQTFNILGIRHYLACEEFRTVDPETQRVKERAIKLAERNEPVLVTGESGVGKELLANILHGTRQGNMVCVNTCAVTDTLFESELFGHVRGSFTGADRDRAGLIAEAKNGTLFLDEIGDMPMALQAKLLRAIHNRQYRNVGSDKMLPVECRIVAATHQDIKALCQEGKFRLDLYERLAAWRLRIPALRQRACDWELFASKELVRHIHKLVAGYTTGMVLSGNIRQLCNLQLNAEVFGVESIGLEDVL